VTAGNTAEATEGGRVACFPASCILPPTPNKTPGRSSLGPRSPATGHPPFRGSPAGIDTTGGMVGDRG
jgi:hypothetical protein